MKQYKDEKDQEHFTTEIFSRDDQGILYKTKAEQILLLDASAVKKDHKTYLSPCFLPLYEIQGLLMPMYSLKEPDRGYVLKLPQGYVPLSSIMNLDKNQSEEMYYKTGGLKRRLQILTNLGAILSKLHYQPMHYGALDPDRIFISKNSLEGDVCLLYSDQISFSVNFMNQSQRAASKYYPGNDEKTAGKGMIADIFSFAALSLDLITSGSNFPIKNKALAQLLNAATKPENYPYQIPKLSEIIETLSSAQNTLLTCASCQKEFTFGEEKCPHCGGNTGRMFKADIYDIVSSATIEHGYKIFQFIMDKQYFMNYHTSYLLSSEPVKKSIEFMLNISPDKKLHVLYKNLMDKTIQINGTDVKPGAQKDILLPCKEIKISIPTYTETLRCIDIVIL